jgi:hypothetical protein
LLLSIPDAAKIVLIHLDIKLTEIESIPMERQDDNIENVAGSI